jgi:hypothetical protein
MASPQSWDCPICLRHVPAKVAECYCGYHRSEPVVAAAPTPARTVVAAVGAVVFLIGGAAAWVLQAPPPPPAPSPLAQARTATTPPPTRPPVQRPSAMPDAWKALAIETTPSPAGAASSAAPTPSPSPTATPDESVDAQRAQGLAAFEAAIAGLTARVADFREKLRRYDAQCEASNTAITGCDTARAELRSVAQAIASDVEAADEQARRSWVDPGQRRSLRERGGVDENAIREVLKAASDAARR